jgi:hypothetical protein
MKLSAMKRHYFHFLSNQGKEISIEDYVDRETAVGRK